MKPASWRDVMIGVMPNVLWLAARTAWASTETIAGEGLGDALAALAAGCVIGLAMWRERRLALWALPAVGTGLMGLWASADRALRAGLPQPETLPYPDWYITGRVALAFGIMDPTYGLMIAAPGTFGLAGIAALDLIPQALFLIAVPVTMLRAENDEAQVARLLGAFALSLVSMVLIGTLHAFADRAVYGARPLAEELGYTLTVGPLIAAVFWGVLAGITYLCSRLRTTDAGSSPEGRIWLPWVSA